PRVGATPMQARTTAQPRAPTLAGLPRDLRLTCAPLARWNEEPVNLQERTPIGGLLLDALERLGRSERDKPPQIPAMRTRYPRTPRSSPPSAVRRKAETPQQRVSCANGAPSSRRLSRETLGWRY